MAYPDRTPIDPDIRKWQAELAAKVAEAHRSPLLALRDRAGRPLYTVSSGGNVRRTRKLTPARRRAVLDRDGRACIRCGATADLHIDHIDRYADGGSDDLDNLRTLCRSCHGSRGGRP